MFTLFMLFLHIKFFIFTIAQIVPSASVPLQARSVPLDQNESRSGEPCLLGCSLLSWVRVREPYSTKKKKKKTNCPLYLSHSSVSKVRASNDKASGLFFLRRIGLAGLSRHCLTRSHIAPTAATATHAADPPELQLEEAVAADCSEWQGML